MGAGERGPEGGRGERGPAGDKGAHGQHGDIGLTGVQGEEGEQGLVGEKGERGDTGQQGESTILSRHVSVSFLLLALVATIVLAVMGFSITQNRNLIHRVDRQQQEISALAKSTHGSLCTFVADLQRRRDDSVAYLKTHPRGVVSPVTQAVIFSRAEIEQSIRNQESTLKALSGLKCRKLPNAGS